VAISEKAQDPHMLFEYDLSYCGGNYDKASYETVYVPTHVIDQMGIEEGFRQWTGIDPRHITFYESELLYTENGEWLEQ